MNAYERAANRLHHLSMRYVGALQEVACGQKVGLIGKNHPGNKEMRDLVDLILLTRAEINGLTQILVNAKLITLEAFEKLMTEQYEYLTDVKAKQLGVEVSDVGLVFKNDPTRN